MKQNLTETRPQRWRALVTYGDGQEGLLCLGQNFNQVQEYYDTPYFELLDDEERSRVKSISLQKWQGMSDSGRWETQRDLPIPQSVEMPFLPIMVKAKA